LSDDNELDEIDFNNLDFEEEEFKFDVIIGNPPYQEELKDTSDRPIYHLFMDAAYKIAKRVAFITPARFLFNAGKTPKAWNKKMLEDEHLKVIFYEQEAARVFPNNPFEGGVAITYRDADENYGAIGLFISIPELDSIAKKITNVHKVKSMTEIAYSSMSYKFTNVFHEEHPEAKLLLSAGHANDITSKVFDFLNFVFLDTKPDISDNYIQIYGTQNNKRVCKWIKGIYIRQHPNLHKYKVFQGNSNGASGTLSNTPARIITPPVMMPPGIGHTQTFLSFGAFDTEQEAVSATKYIKTRFTRVLLSILKVTQHNPPEKWKYVPLQDFTPTSDIDWTKTIPEIDQQLYAKYNLDDTEIAFIESHIEEMA